jgi:hypothetical protein
MYDVLYCFVLCYLAKADVRRFKSHASTLRADRNQQNRTTPPTLSFHDSICELLRWFESMFNETCVCTYNGRYLPNMA